jgi:RHS repeat-associated protein
LTREDNAKLGRSYTFEYDGNGNIRSKTRYKYTLKELTNGSSAVYTYSKDDWRDRLLQAGGKNCEYDVLGNPTVYRGRELEWDNLRDLKKYSDIEYSYDAEGLRLSKKRGRYAESRYDYFDGRLIREIRKSRKSKPAYCGVIEFGEYIYENDEFDLEYHDVPGKEPEYFYVGESRSVELQYLYGANGLTGFIVKREGEEDKTYYYKKNIQGDITAIYDAEGGLSASYIYDAWGNHIINSDESGIGALNPFRYRGYYYDTESGLYYLKSRYYDPDTGRFINADDISEIQADVINGLNLYAYCMNNPVTMTDSDGCAPEWLKWFGIGMAIVGAVLVIAAITVLTAGVGTTVLAGTLAGAIIHGAAVGALIGAGIGVTAGAVIGGAVSNWSAEGILIGAGLGLGFGAVAGAVIGGAVGGVQFGTFASNASLNSHLAKHGTKMGYSSAKEYAKGAKYVINNGTKISYTYKGKITTGYVRFLGQNGGANYAFVGMNGTRVATFGIRSVSELIRLGIPWLMI